MQRIIQTTYNYAGNTREKYLMLKLLRVAMKKEVEHLENQADWSTGNLTVVKLVVNHYRGEGSNGCLEKILAPMVKRLLADVNLDLSVDPKDAYKQWINETERVTGEKSKLPYEAEREEALKHPAVVERVATSETRLREYVTGFQDAIIAGLADLPFELRLLCADLKGHLKERFPSITPPEIAKALGNLVMTRYFNPAVISPDAYGIVADTGQVSISYSYLALPEWLPSTQ